MRDVVFFGRNSIRMLENLPFREGGKAIITGKPVNRGAGYGMEIPCKYVFYGDVETSLPWLKSKLDYLGYSVWYNQ